MNELSFWLNANEVILNVARTEVILFKTNHKLCNTNLRLKLYRKRLFKSKCFRYPGIKTDENLNWKIHIYDLMSKSHRATTVLANLRYFVNREILRSTDFAIFHSHLCLFSKKALRIMNFAPFNAHTVILFKNCNNLKLADIINVERCVSINNCFNKDSFSIFNENFKLV